MLLSDGNLRAVNFVIRAHGEFWNDDKYKYLNAISEESRLMFVMQGEMIYEIYGKRYVVRKNHMMLIPERQSFSMRVPKDGYVRVQYCNFSATLENESVLDYLDGAWAAETDEPEEVLKRFKRFHYVNEDNLMLDCLEKRGNLLYLLTEFVRTAQLRTVTTKTKVGDLFNGIAQYIKRYDGPHKELTIEKLAKMANIHPHYFISEFKKRFGKTPMQYASDARMDRAKMFLSGTDMQISEISERLAFEDPKYFSKFFKRHTGETPTEYRKVERNKRAD